MKRTIVVLAILMTAFCGLGISAPVQGRGNNKPQTSGGLVFGGVEIRIIKEWFANPSNLSGLPPGLAKRDRLPPGLEKQLRRNGELPPGLQKKIQPLPPALEVKLPRLPDGYRRVIAAGTVILLDTKLNRILDLVTNVL